MSKLDEQRVAVEEELHAQGEEVTSDRVEAVIRHRALVAEDLERNPLPEEFVGKTPDQEDEVAFLRERVQQSDQERAEDRRKIQTLTEALAETNDLVKKLAADKGGYTGAIAAAEGIEAEHENRKRYSAIRARGNRCTITLHSNPDPALNQPVPVAVNGRKWTLPRGVPLEVPAEVVEVLDHAEVDTWVNQVDDEGNPRHVHLKYLVYPYTLTSYGRDAA